MSEVVRLSLPYLDLLVKKSSRKLYRAIISESPDYLIKALSEIVQNFVEENQRKKVALFKNLADRQVSLKRKRRLLLTPTGKKRIIQLCVAVLRDIHSLLK